MKIELLKGLRIVERADTNSMRTVMFARYAEKRATVRLVLQLFTLLNRVRLASVLVGGYAAAAFLQLGTPKTGAAILALARFANARHQLESVASYVGSERVAWARFGHSQLLSLRQHRALFAQLGQRRALRRLLHYADRVCRRHDFYVSCRLVSTVALYARSLQILDDVHPRAVMVSSDYNTEEVAMTRAARRKHIASVFVAHAHTNRLSPPLDFDLAILDGEAALATYREKGPVAGRIVFRGVEGPSQRFDFERVRAAAPVIGLFMPSQIRWEVLREIVQGCRQRFGPSRFRVRWHPNMIEGHRLDLVTNNLSDIDISPPGTALVEDASMCNFVIADESSNVHLTVLKMGVPTMAVEGLGLHPADMFDQYGFITNGVIPPLIPSAEAIDLADIVAFYGGAWEDRFRYYDAGFMRPQQDVDEDVRRAIVGGLRVSC